LSDGFSDAEIDIKMREREGERESTSKLQWGDDLQLTKAIGSQGFDFHVHRQNHAEPMTGLPIPDPARLRWITTTTTTLNDAVVKEVNLKRAGLDDGEEEVHRLVKDFSTRQGCLRH
jgi:hypothetical protein